MNTSNRFLVLVFALGLLTLPSCEKAGGGEKKPAETGLTGTWLGAEYVADPGNGDTSWHPFTDETEVLHFNSTGKGTIFSNGVQSSGYYQVTSDSSMDIIGGAMSASIRYRLSGDTLDISGQCIEACVTRYLRGKED